MIELRDKACVISELAKAMDLLAQDEDLASRMSAAGCERALEQKFRWSALISQWAKLDQEVLNAHLVARKQGTEPAQAVRRNRESADGIQGLRLIRECACKAAQR